MYTITCPHCGASVNIDRRNQNDMYQCSYCNSLLSGVNASLGRASNTSGGVYGNSPGANIRSANRNTNVRTAPVVISNPEAAARKGLRIFITLFIILLCFLLTEKAISKVKRERERTEAAQTASTQEKAVETTEGVAITKENSNEEKASVAENQDNSDENIEDSGENADINFVEDTYLIDMLSLKQGDVKMSASSRSANTGEEFSNYMYAYNPYQEVVYKLNGDYSNLKGLWCIDSYSKDTNSRNGFRVYTDNVLKYESPILTRGDIPVYVDVDITGCDILTIMFTEGEGAAVLADVRLTNSEAKVPNPVTPNPDVLPCWLTDMDYLTVDGVHVIDAGNYATNTGEPLAHFLSGRQNSEIVYYLKGQYSTISGYLAIKEYDKNTTDHSSIAIYADDQLAYMSPSISGGDIPQYFENVSINNCEKLRIVFLEDGDYEAALANVRVYP